MRFISFDFETHLIAPGQLCPRLVCMSYVERDGSPAGTCDVYTAADCEETGGNDLERGLCLRERALQLLNLWLQNDDICLVGHNCWFDFGVLVAEEPRLLSSIFAKLDKGLIRDTQLRQQLIDVATGEMKFHEDDDGEEMLKTKYDLASTAYRVLKKWLKKKDTWRLRYALLDGVPLDEWPEEAKRYAIDDSVTALEIYEEQDRIAGVGDTCTEIPNSLPQHQAAWALHLMSCWGVRTDGAAVAKLKAELERDYSAAMEALRPSGLLRFTPARHYKSGPRKGQVKEAEVSKIMKVIKARVEACYAQQGKQAPLSDSGQNTSTSKKTLTESGDPQLKQLAEAGGIGKLLNTYVPVLESGTRYPICARYNPLVETGRTSCSSPNMQNPPRGSGVRACFVPRPGWVFASADYDTLELRALAQVCLDVLGKSKMAEALRRGEDLHLSLAAEMLGISVDEAKRRKDAGDAEIAEYRQQAKPANFGFPGAMAAESFREYAEGYGIKLSSEQAKELHDTWFRKWPEMHAYFAWVSTLNESGEPVTQIRSGRVRGGAGYCAIANGFFQGLSSDGAKEALWRVARECYVDTSSPLFGCRPVIYLHDEIIAEVPEAYIGRERAAAAAARLSTVMVEAMTKFIPDVPVSCKPVMMRRWFKGVEPVMVDGLLVPAKPVVKEVNGKKKVSWAHDL